MTKFTIRYLFAGQILQTEVTADSYDTDDGLIKFDDEDGNDVYWCSINNILDVVMVDVDEDEEEEDEDLEQHVLGHRPKVVHEHYTLKEHVTTVLPAEHGEAL